MSCGMGRFFFFGTSAQFCKAFWIGMRIQQGGIIFNQFAWVFFLFSK